MRRWTAILLMAALASALVETVDAAASGNILVDVNDDADQQMENDWPSYRLLGRTAKSANAIVPDDLPRTWDVAARLPVRFHYRSPGLRLGIADATAVAESETYCSLGQSPGDRLLSPATGRSRNSDTDRYQVPKRALSLLTRWKTLEQLRRNGLSQRSVPLSLSLSSSAHSRRQSKKQQPPPSPKEEFQLPAMSQDMITAVARGYQRSLRPPGQPLRWG